MSTKQFSQDQEAVVSFEDFLQRNGVSRWWQSQASGAQAGTVASLPLETFLQKEEAAEPCPEQQSELFQERYVELQEILEHIQRQIDLSRSIPGEQRELLLTGAKQTWIQAKEVLSELKTLARRMSPQARRRVRALEGLPLWRELRRDLDGRASETQAA